jgi:prepilin-type N-terminal cleavage/methylation domain-containing protein
MKCRNNITPKRRRRGLSLLELLVTLAIIAIIAVAALQIFNNTAEGTRRLQQDMVQEEAIEHCMDLMVEDLAIAAANNIQIRVKNTFLDYDRETAHLTIIAESGARRSLPSRLVEWVAMPREESDDLILYRRVFSGTNRRGSSKYIPMCEGIYSFVVEEITDTLLQVTAWVYRDNEYDPQSLSPVSRMFCVDRYKFYSDTTQGRSGSR